MRHNARRGAQAMMMACALLVSAVAVAQEGSDIAGTVVNAATKKPVQDVVVTATSPQAGEKIAVTDAKGQYKLGGVAPGTYSLRFEGPGFQPYTRNDVTVRLNTITRFDPQLVPAEGLQEEVVVTGSRIPRPEVASAAPVTVVGRQQIETSGRASIGDILQQLPEQSNATNTQVNNGGNGAVRISLRALGAQRTLVLVNGRRMVAGGTGADASVDLNTIPTQAIERVEVLKDGASAAYGSDAIAGVVNVITRKDYAGTELNVFSGLTGRGDGQFYDASFTTGQASDRGNILFSAGFYKQEAVWAGQRDFSRFDSFYDFPSREIYTAGSSSIPQGRFTVPGGSTGTAAGNPAWQELLNRYPGLRANRNAPFTYAGGIYRPYDGSGVTEAGGDAYNYQPANYLMTPLQRVNVYSTGGLRLGQNARGFFELSYTNRRSAQELAPEPLGTATEGIVASGRNVYNPFGVDFPTINRRLVEFGGRHFEQDLDTFRIVTGVEGTLPEAMGPLSGWTWDAAFNYGRTQGVETKQGLLQRSRVAAAIGPSFIDSDGIARCGTPGAVVAECVPLNLFGGPGTITKDMKDYLSYTGTARGFNQQVSVAANVGGELVRLFNAKGATALAVGYEHRREMGANIPDPLTAKGDTTGNKESATQGGYYVNEAYAELSIPLLGRLDGSGAPGDLLEVNGAARIFDYSTFGSGSTYKLGARISPIPDVTLRGTLSNAFRAPSIGQLYAGRIDNFPSVRDPCGSAARKANPTLDANCTAAGIPSDFTDDALQLLAPTGGNANLRPETANTFTAGIVIEPRWVKDLSATIDYFNIDVKDAITNVTASVILAGCYPTEPGVAPNAQYCALIDRDPATLNVRRITDTLQNVGGTKTAGIDFGVRYEPMTPYGRFGFTANLSRLQYYNVTQANGDVIRQRGNYDLELVLPTWRGLGGISWALDAFSAGFNTRWVGAYKECDANTCTRADADSPEPLSRKVDTYFVSDLNLGYRVDFGNAGKTTLLAGVNNLFDTPPVFLANGFTAKSDPSAYDFLGRQFYFRVAHSFY